MFTKFDDAIAMRANISNLFFGTVTGRKVGLEALKNINDSYKKRMIVNLQRNNFGFYVFLGIISGTKMEDVPVMFLNC